MKHTETMKLLRYFINQKIKKADTRPTKLSTLVYLVEAKISRGYFFMRIFEKNGVIIVKLNYQGKKYLRTFFKVEIYEKWMENIIGEVV